MIIYKDIKQGSDEWLDIRAGVITWTKLKGVMAWTKAQETQIFELIWEEFAPLEENYKSPAMERWNELEPIAKAKYEALTSEKVEEVWFIKSNKIKDKHNFLWLSPDWIIITDITDNKEPIYWKAIEIKCPWAKNHTKYIIENKIPDEYKNQILNYFLVMPDLEELDFITFNPDYYIKEKQLFIINIKRKDLEKDLEKAKIKILDFRQKWLEYINLIIK